MKDEKFLREMSRIYQSLECLKNIEAAYVVDDMVTCKLLTDIYPQFAGIESVEFIDVYNTSTRVKNAKELYFWCSEDVEDNVHQVLSDEYWYWIGQFEKICKEFLARLSYDAATITEQMQIAFFEVLWDFMRILKGGSALNSIARASEEVIAKAPAVMQELWQQQIKDAAEDEPIGTYISSMMDVLHKRGCSDDEISGFFNLLDINCEIVHH